MRSLLNLLEANEVLASVKVEGLRRRRRRQRRNLALGGLAAVLLAAPAVALLGGDDGGEDITVAAGADDDGAEADDEPSPVTTAPRLTPGAPQTTVPVATTVPADVQGAVIERPPVTQPPPTVVAPLVCRNSTDPACGPLSWDPAPAADQPAALSDPGTITVAPGGPVSLDWSDPDASLGWDLMTTGDVAIGGGCQYTVAARHGPWDAPAPRPGSGTLTYTAPTEPGTYTAVVSIGTHSGVGGDVVDCQDPYFSEAQRTFTLVVEA